MSVPYRPSRCSIRATCSPDAAAVSDRRFHAAANPAAPTSGTRSVTHSGTFSSSPCATASTASLAITRYVVYFPPATTTSPGAACATTCSRDSCEVDSDSPDSSGRSPA